MSDALIERLRRILVLVPYVAAHPEGVPVDEALRFAGYPRRQDLYDDVQMLMYIGDPAGSPDELVEALIDQDRVYVALPQGFRRPPRLSVVEAAALHAAAESLRESAGEVLQRAAQKLSRALPAGSDKALDTLARAAAIDAPPPPPCRAALEQAIAERRVVEVDYWAASTAQKRTRALHPRVVFLHRGRWYLSAFDPAKGEDRLYRLDRVAAVTLTGATFPPREEDWRRFDTVDVLLFGDHPRSARVTFQPQMAVHAREVFPDATTAADGSVGVTLPVASERFLVSWLLGLGGAARADEPAPLREAVVEGARRLLARYAD